MLRFKSDSTVNHEREDQRSIMFCKQQNLASYLFFFLVASGRQLCFLNFLFIEFFANK